MRHYPLFLNLEGKKAVVFGAGKVALRKIRDLLRCGARVEVTSREFSRAVIRLAESAPFLKLKSNASAASMLKRASLVFVTTSDRGYNRKIASLCRRKGLWVNVADQPEECDFFVPSLVKKGRLQVAISTGGASPLLAKKFRRELSASIRPEALRILDRMGGLRKLAKASIASPSKRKAFLKGRLSSDFHFLKNGINTR